MNTQHTQNKHHSHQKLYIVIAVLVLIVATLAGYAIVNQQAQPKDKDGLTVKPPQETSNATTTLSEKPEPPLFPYIEVVESCGPYYSGACVNMRSGPGTEYPSVKKLRTGMVLKVADIVKNNDRTWYKIALDDTLRYPERVEEDWYIAADVVHLFYDDGDHRYTKDVSPPTNKRIIVDLSDETLYAYDGKELFMKEVVSTGLEFTPTPRGRFIVYKMTPSRYMQGPIPGISTEYYDLPGVPWNLYFTEQGAVIHGAYWHDKFGQRWSHGCVNLPPEKAKQLYLWADIGTSVTIQD